MPQLLAWLVLGSLATVVACGGKPSPIPESKVNCGSGGYQKIQSFSEAPLPSGALRAQSEAVSSVRQAIDDPVRNTHYDTSPGRLPQLVQIRLYNDATLVGVGTGTVIGRTSVLTAAHTFYGRNYNRAMLAVRVLRDPNDPSAGYDLAETPLINQFIPAFYRAEGEMLGPNQTNGILPWTNDIALGEVAIDFQALGIAPMRVVTDFIPDRDCNECPTTIVQLVGFGGGPIPRRLTDVVAHGVQARPLNDAANIEQTRMMTFNNYLQAGDSGGPVLRFNSELVNARGQRGDWELVGIILGEDQEANENFEIDPDGNAALGDYIVGVTGVPTQAQMHELETLADGWRDQNRHLINSSVYPAPAPVLPNGQPNATVTVPPDGDAGPSVPIAGSGITGVDGYFVGDFPFPPPAAAPRPNGPGGGCASQ